jgi:hypothetical protein
MVNYFYVCSKEDEKYSDTFRTLACIEGDRNNLVEQVSSARDFCKDERAIGYEYFLQSINTDTVLYIESDSGNVLGCCSISINYPDYISISGICVPNRGNKGIGTALIDKLKEIANSLELHTIGLSALPSAQTFYLKNGFKIFDHKNRNDDIIDSDNDSIIDIDSDMHIDSEYSMMRYTLPKAGKNKSKKVNKYKKSKKSYKKVNKSKKSYKKYKKANKK